MCKSNEHIITALPQQNIATHKARPIQESTKVHILQYFNFHRWSDEYKWNPEDASSCNSWVMGLASLLALIFE